MEWNTSDSFLGCCRPSHMIGRVCIRHKGECGNFYWPVTGKFARRHSRYLFMPFHQIAQRNSYKTQTGGN